MSKYHSTPTYVYGIRFDSKTEAERYLVLMDRVRHGTIHDLRRQVEFRLADTVYRDPKHKRGVILKGCSYKADFTYTTDSGEYVVEDVKGVKTEAFNIKKKWVYDKYGIIIREVYSVTEGIDDD